MGTQFLFTAMDLDDYEQLKAFAKKIYSKIGSVYCPLLDDFVCFTNQGFDHLVRKDHKFRTRSEQLRRFALIPHLKDIVMDPKAEIHLDESRGVRFWILVKHIDGKRVRVVIMESGSRKIFLSVYPPKE